MWIQAAATSVTSLPNVKDSDAGMIGGGSSFCSRRLGTGFGGRVNVNAFAEVRNHILFRFTCHRQAINAC